MHYLVISVDIPWFLFFFLHKQRLSTIGEDDGGVSFERLAAFSDAFEAVIKQGGVHAPTLRKIKV